jgi:hemerythrin-like domain-containing protein
VPRLAIRILRDEHLALASVLYGLRWLARRIRDDGEPPDFRLLHAILDYIVEFPEKLHHPKEDRLLFAAVLRRDPRARALVAELEAEHRQGAALIRELQAALVAYARDGHAAMARFVDTAEAYADFHARHMRKEEERLLPLAQRCLDDQDWAGIDAAFRDNDNPLFGVKPKEQCEALFRRILELAPPPLGGGARIVRA